jgi:hypothetical protein
MLHIHVDRYMYKEVVGSVQKSFIYEHDLLDSVAAPDDFIDPYLFENISEQIEFLKPGERQAQQKLRRKQTKFKVVSPGDQQGSQGQQIHQERS